MTNSNGDRNDDLENVKQILFTVARQYEASERRMSATDSRIDRLVENQDRTQQQLDQLGGKVDQLSGKVDQLTEDVDIAFQTITALSDNTDRTLASINASIQRQDKILDYLLRLSNGDQTQP